MHVTILHVQNTRHASYQAVSPVDHACHHFACARYLPYTSPCRSLGCITRLPHHPTMHVTILHMQATNHTYHQTASPLHHISHYNSHAGYQQCMSPSSMHAARLHQMSTMHVTITMLHMQVIDRACHWATLSVYHVCHRTT